MVGNLPVVVECPPLVAGRGEGKARPYAGAKTSRTCQPNSLRGLTKVRGSGRKATPLADREKGGAGVGSGRDDVEELDATRHRAVFENAADDRAQKVAGEGARGIDASS